MSLSLLNVKTFGLFTVGNEHVPVNLQGGSQNFKIISSCSQLKSDWSILNAGINRNRVRDTLSEIELLMRSSEIPVFEKEMHVWSSEMDNRATYSDCRGIVHVCRGILPLCRGILFVCRGILLDVLTCVAAHKHENEVEWFWRQKRDTFSTAFSAQLVNWQYSGKSIAKNRYSFERPGM